MDSANHHQSEKRPSIQLVAPPLVSTRLSIDGPFLPIELPRGERKPSLKTIPSRVEDPDENAPKDPYSFIKITLFILGFTSILPASFLTTANEYWMYKFRNVSAGEHIMLGYSRTPLQVEYAKYLLLAIILPDVLLSLVFSFVGHKIKMNLRARLYFLLLLMMFLIHFILSMVNTDAWQETFFKITMGSQIILSLGLSLGMVIMPIANKFPKKYLGAHMVGQGLGGILTSTTRLISISCTKSVTASGTVYFGAGVVLMILAIILYEITLRTECYKYYVTKVQKEDAKKATNSIFEIIEVSKKVWGIVILCVMNIVFPAGAVTTLVASQSKGNAWSDTYFVTVCTYFLPAIADLSGRALANIFGDLFNLPVLFLLSLAKFSAFTPLIFLCNAAPRHHFAVVFDKDWEYALIMIGNSLLSGYLLNTIILRTIKLGLKQEHMELAFRIVTMCLGAAGALMSPLSVVAIDML